jgi:hypothetical protein
MNGWKYYNYAVIPSTPPHIGPNLSCLSDGSVWKVDGGTPLLVRWATDFDCGYETEWWYLIKDDEMDIGKLKKKRRYEINSGLSNFNVKKISASDYAEQIYDVYLEAFQNYLNAGKPITKQEFINDCLNHEMDPEIEYYGAFDKEDGKLAGYALNHVYENYVNFTTMKFAPRYLAKKVSAALIYIMLYDYLNLQKKNYVNDGERSIRHITNFQDYLIKYFGFRRAYCRLHVEYRMIIRVAIKVLYPFRNIIRKVARNSLLNNISSLLDMEKIRRTFDENKQKQISL